jgi:hypothetical protein
VIKTFVISTLQMEKLRLGRVKVMVKVTQQVDAGGI